MSFPAVGFLSEGMLYGVDVAIVDHKDLSNQVDQRDGPRRFFPDLEGMEYGSLRWHIDHTDFIKPGGTKGAVPGTSS